MMPMAFNGFGNKPLFNTDQRFGGGYDPITGAMSLNGSPSMSEEPAAAPSSPPHPSFFGQGGAGRSIAGYVGDALLSMSGGRPVYGPTVAAQREQEQMLRRQMELARYKAEHPDPTGTMQNVQAAGLAPGTPEYQAFMQKILQQPHYMVLGNTENGQQVIDANNPPMSGPPAEAVARLKANPAEAAQFDEIFGQGAAARAMGGQ